MNKMHILRKRVLEFIERHRIPGGGAGHYRYSVVTDIPTLYSSTYAAMTKFLFDDLRLSSQEQQEWIEYFNSHQDNDGLFRDPVIFNQGWYLAPNGRRTLSAIALPPAITLDSAGALIT